MALAPAYMEEPWRQDLDLLSRTLACSIDLLQFARELAAARGDDQLSAKIAKSKLELLDVVSLAQGSDAGLPAMLCRHSRRPDPPWFPPTADEIAVVRARLPDVTLSTVVVLCRLLCVAGRYVSTADLANAAQVKGDRAHRVINVYICQLRKSLAAHGIPGAIVTGTRSYLIPEKQAYLITALLNACE